MSKQSHIHGAGNVYRMNGSNNSNCTKWMITVPLGRVNGKFKQRRKRFTGTHAEAMAEMKRMLQVCANEQVRKRALRSIFPKPALRSESGRTSGFDEIQEEEPEETTALHYFRSLANRTCSGAL